MTTIEERVIQILANHGWQPPYPTTAILSLITDEKRRLLSQGVEAERASYWPKGLEKMITAWPIIEQPVYLIPAALVEAELKDQRRDRE